VESISDIVWSIRPQKEGDLSQRIRRFGSDALTSRQIGVVFDISDEIHRLTLDPNARRQVYLIYKEAVHNTVRHAQATAVEISMSIVGGDLVLKIGDNGKGMANREEGNGLPGMRWRALSLGGRLAVHSTVGRGTEVELRVPLRPKRRSRILPG
jgi:signal transduction histidine kinase